MDRYCQNPTCQNEAVEEVEVSVDRPSDQKRALCATCREAYDWGVQHGLHHRAPGLHILPPPGDEGPRPLYRVVYVIDVDASDSREAARQTHDIMLDPGSMLPVLHVLDGEGSDAVVDLAGERSEADTEPSANTEARRFVASAATRCPECSSENIDFASMEIVGQSAYHEASCLDCDTKFHVVYRLVGFALEVEGTMEVHTIAEDFRQIQGGPEEG